MKWKSCMMALLVLLTFTACTPQEEEAVSAKPVIYLYPEQETDVTVQLDHDGPLTATYPAYEAGWNIHAKPDGTLIDPETGRMYYCLFWEGVTETEYDFSEGFCVAGADMADFLEQALAVLGLTEREANEFLIYWLPRMEQNEYNLISFQSEAYTDHACLSIQPEPDTVIRVFMAYKPVENEQEIPEQTLAAPERSGFAVVEWGGCELP